MTTLRIVASRLWFLPVAVTAAAVIELARVRDACDRRSL